jgi:pimeloyl-ACP methyl ester carboxylesterase
MNPRFALILLALFFVATPLPAQETPAMKRTAIKVGENKGFVIVPPKPGPEGERPWVWYAPTIGPHPSRETDWMFRRLHDAGFYIAGVDVGESMGNPAGRKVYSAFHEQMVREYQLEPKARLIAQSRGGLMLYNWAVENPEKVRCVVGIYTVCDMRSYPELPRAAEAYGLTVAELEKVLPQHNPIDRLEPLAKAKVPLLHIHGDSDKVVPLEANSKTLIERYQKLDGPAELIVIPGKGHETAKEFFEDPRLVEFLKSTKLPGKDEPKR